MATFVSNSPPWHSSSAWKAPVTATVRLRDVKSTAPCATRNSKLPVSLAISTFAMVICYRPYKHRKLLEEATRASVRYFFPSLLPVGGSSGALYRTALQPYPPVMRFACISAIATGGIVSISFLRHAILTAHAAPSRLSLHNSILPLVAAKMVGSESVSGSWR